MISRFSALYLVPLLVACGSSGAVDLDGSVGADSGAPCTGCAVVDCHFETLVPAADNTLLRFKRGVTEVVLARAVVGQGAGHSAIYETKGLSVQRGGSLQCLTTGLDYESSHHNWFDHAFATDAANSRYELEIKFQPPGQDPLVEWVWTYTLRGKDAAGGALFPDELLDLVSGQP